MKAIWIAFMIVAAIPAPADESPRLPDTSNGTILGLRALIVAPAEQTAEGFMRVLPLDGCSVHLVPDTDKDQEFTFVCGSWFVPPKPGIYRVWMEQGATFSHPRTLHYKGEKFGGSGLITVDVMYAAGYVTTPNPGTGRSVRLLSLTRTWPHAFERRVTAAGTHNPVRMPVGSVIAGYFDKQGNATALSKPTDVRADELSQVAPRSPEIGSDLLVVIDRPVAASGCRPILAAAAGGANHTPAVLVPSPAHIVAVWYGLSPGPIEVKAQCNNLQWGAKLNAKSPGVLTARGALMPRP